MGNAYVNGENNVRDSHTDLFHIQQGYTIQNDTDLFLSLKVDIHCPY